MRSIIIKEIHFVNFKGFRNMTIEFNEDITTICGRNGSGKTSIFDGFTWLLFGKDSQDRKAFNIKTLDENGKAIPKLPHEVSAIIVVDGETIELCRRFNEKWVKRRGQIEEEFTGHEEERLYNNVPMSLKEWNEKISNICSEQVFKFITNPKYFVSQKPDVQRAMLFRMAGELSDADIAAGNDDFSALLASLTGKTMEEYKKEIQAKKRRIKAEIEAIPERIDERKRDMPEAENWMLLDADLNTKKSQLSEIEKAIADKSQAYKNASDTRLKLQQKLSNLRQEKQNREFKIKERVQSDYYAECKSQRELNDNLSLDQNELSRVRSEMQGYQRDLEALKAKRETLIAEWREIKARTLQFKNDEFVCPTCKRPLDIDDIERKQNEMTANFNTKKATDLEENNRKGHQVKKSTQETEALIKKCEERISEIEARIETIKNSPLYSKSLVAPDAAPAIEADEEIKNLIQQIAELEETVNTPIDVPDTAELNDQKKSITDEIDAIKAKLAKKETIERNEARIKELEKQLREQSEELAKLEGIEFTIAAFSKARIEAVENRINGLFSIVKFKMFEQQINGGEVETCEAIVNGVPYSDLNNAMKIIAGLDIISAICKYEQITAPCFLDNAEAINNVPKIASQMILLVVTEDDKLIVK